MVINNGITQWYQSISIPCVGNDPNLPTAASCLLNLPVMRRTRQNITALSHHSTYRVILALLHRRQNTTSQHYTDCIKGLTKTPSPFFLVSRWQCWVIFYHLSAKVMMSKTSLQDDVNSSLHQDSTEKFPKYQLISPVTKLSCLSDTVGKIKKKRNWCRKHVIIITFRSVAFRSRVT